MLSVGRSTSVRIKIVLSSVDSQTSTAKNIVDCWSTARSVWPVLSLTIRFWLRPINWDLVEFCNQFFFMKIIR